MTRPTNSSRGPCRTPRRQSGLTLIEMLVSMVILGFVMALVSEAVFQVSQVARAASATTQSLTDRWSAGWAVSDLLANLVAPEGASADVVMQGSSSRISGYSTLPLEDTDTGIQPFELALQVDPEDRDRTAMLWTARSTAGASAASKVVARVSGRAEFVYLRRNGEIVSEWPPLTRTERDAEDLPRAVLLRDASSGRHLLWYDCPGEPIRPRPVRNPFEVTP